MSPDFKRRLATLLRGGPFGLGVMRIAARVVAPKQCIGAVGAIFDDVGRVLVVEHVFRTDFPWGLPGGWVERLEEPSGTVKREIEDELKLRVDVRDLLLSEQVGRVAKSTHPPHIGLAYYCRFISGTPALSPEILSVEWCDPLDIHHDLAPFQRRAIELGRLAFVQESRTAGPRDVIGARS